MIYIGLAVSVVVGAIGAYLAETKGRPHLEGFLFGFFLGLIGILIIFILPKRTPKD